MSEFLREILLRTLSLQKQKQEKQTNKKAVKSK